MATMVPDRIGYGKNCEKKRKENKASPKTTISKTAYCLLFPKSLKLIESFLRFTNLVSTAPTRHLGANKGYALKNKYFTIKNHTLISTTNVWLVQREATWRNRVARTPHAQQPSNPACQIERESSSEPVRSINTQLHYTTRQFFIHFILLYYLIKKSQDGAFIIGDIRDNSYILLQLFGEMIDRASSTNFAGNERATLLYYYYILHR
jgi:hypothetical protein